AEDATPDAIAAIRQQAAALANGTRLLDVSQRNVLRAGFLAAVFPEASFVWVYREPHRAVYDPRETEPPTPSERATLWANTMTALLADLQELPAGTWITVPYRLVATYPDQALNQITQFLRVRWDGQLPPHRDDPAIERDQMPDLPTVEEITSPVATRARELFGKAGPRAARPREQRGPVDEEAKAAAFRSSATNNFGELLRALNASLVISTYQSGCVILIRAEPEGGIGTTFRMFRSPMGMAVRKGELALGTKTELWDFRNVPAIAKQQVEPVGKHDACFLPRRMHVTGDIRVHEIGYANDELWLVNTRFSALCTLDGETSFVPRWRPKFISRLAAEDRCHLNGMAIVDGKVRYVSALGTTDTAGGWRATRVDGGVVMDVDSKEIVVRGLSMPHSPRQYDGRFYILESGKGSIATADLASGRVETVAELPGFTRGLAFAGPFAFVGLSQVRESNIFGGLPLTERVEERQCGIYVVDLRNGETVAWLRFEGTVHEIFDVQLLYGIRYPHIVDLGDPLVSSAFGVPDSALPDFA
ncbi:MAG: TIGR03032 family protein, partial [Thermoanaerobaculia bacterium]